MIPATKFASTWRAAKPMIAAAITPEASRLRARLEIPSKPESATATPIRRITAYSSRRTKRRRVATSRESPVRFAASRTACARNARSSSVAIVKATRIDTPALIQALTWMPVSAASMKAILLDAMGTLIGFEPPAPHLQAELHARGYEIDAVTAGRAIRDEIAYYRAHLGDGRDAESLHDLRLRCADAMRLDGIPRETVLDALLAALRFYAYPDSAPALIALRERGLRLVVVSNWDFSLHERLAETGLEPLLDGAIAS